MQLPSLFHLRIATSLHERLLIVKTRKILLGYCVVNIKFQLHLCNVSNIKFQSEKLYIGYCICGGLLRYFLNIEY